MTKLRNEDIQKFLDGDDSIFPKIFNIYQKNIYYLAINILHNEADSEEAIQNTFIEIIMNRYFLRNARAFNVWLYKIAYHNILDIYRKNKKISLTINKGYSVENHPSKEETLTELIRKKIIFEDIQKEINKLPKDMREV